MHSKHTHTCTQKHTHTHTHTHTIVYIWTCDKVDSLVGCVIKENSLTYFTPYKVSDFNKCPKQTNCKYREV